MRTDQRPAFAMAGSSSPQDGARVPLPGGALFTISVWFASRLVLLGTYGATALAGRALPFQEVFARWDSSWYLTIAHGGYQWDPALATQQSPAFFPLWPLLLALINGVAGGIMPLPFAGAVAASLLFLAALLGLHALLEAPLGTRATRWTILFIAFGPTSLYFSLPYTESLFLALAVGFFLAWERRHTALALAAALALGLCRSNGWIVPAAVVLAELPGLRAGRPGRLPEALALAVASAAGLLAYLGFCAVRLGDPLAPIRVQRAWGVEPFTFLPTYLRRTLAFLRREPGAGFGIPLDGTWALACALGAALAFRVRELLLPWRCYALFGALFPLLMLGGDGIRSTIRYGSVIFPLWAGLAFTLENHPRLRLAVFAAGGALCLAFAARFFAGGWVQ